MADVMMKPCTPAWRELRLKEQETVVDSLIDRSRNSLKRASDYADPGHHIHSDIKRRKRLCMINLRRAEVFHAAAEKLGWCWSASLAEEWIRLTRWVKSEPTDADRLLYGGFNG